MKKKKEKIRMIVVGAIPCVIACGGCFVIPFLLKPEANQSYAVPVIQGAIALLGFAVIIVTGIFSFSIFETVDKKLDVGRNQIGYYVNEIYEKHLSEEVLREAKKKGDDFEALVRDALTEDYGSEKKSYLPMLSLLIATYSMAFSVTIAGCLAEGIADDQNFSITIGVIAALTLMAFVCPMFVSAFPQANQRKEREMIGVFLKEYLEKEVYPSKAKRDKGKTKTKVFSGPSAK